MTDPRHDLEPAEMQFLRSAFRSSFADRAFERCVEIAEILHANGDRTPTLFIGHALCLEHLGDPIAARILLERARAELGASELTDQTRSLLELLDRIEAVLVSEAETPPGSPKLSDLQSDAMKWQPRLSTGGGKR